MADFQSFWQRRGALNILLLPLSWLFAAAAAVRRRVLLAAHSNPLRRRPPALPPVIVIGNIVVGGSGKTPIVIALARALAARGWHPGIISRGYGATGATTSTAADTILVQSDSNWRQCGDEPLLIARCTALPVCIGKNRVQAAQRLAEQGCNVLLSDDGLQHYALPRQMEICVSDARYRHGNGWRLPAGPLREGIARVAQCDLHLLSGGSEDENNMLAVPRRYGRIYPLAAPQDTRPADFFHGKTVTALAGIAHPTNFFAALETLGIRIDEKKPLPDHVANDLAQIKSDAIIMTEKDAVKYDAADPRLYALAMDCDIPEPVLEMINAKIAPQIKTRG